MAFGWGINLVLLAQMLVGLGLIIASGCVINNVIDRRIDKLMMRTHKRAIVQGKVSVRAAIVYGTGLGLLGAAILAVYTTPIALATALFGWVAYVIFYGYAKRKSPWGTEVGSISGAVPPVVGYTAVTGQYDLGAALLFVLMVLWQMPHFYAIAIFRLSDYKAAGLPVLPAVAGIARTKRRILMYVAAYILAVPLLSIFHYTGWVYLVAMVIMSVIWFVLGVKGFKIQDDVKWARTMFGWSLLVLSVWSLTVAISGFAP